MLLDIQIKNFRCFEDTKIEGFQRVNLIGGKNNSGKTALLEAIFIYISPELTTILFLKQLRKEFFSVNQNLSEDIWRSFFFNRNIKNLIKLTGCEQKIKKDQSKPFIKQITLEESYENRELRNRGMSIELKKIETYMMNNNHNEYDYSESFFWSRLNKNKISVLSIKCQFDLATLDAFPRKNQQPVSCTVEHKIMIEDCKMNVYTSQTHNSIRFNEPINRQENEHIREILDKNIIFCSSSFAKVLDQQLVKNFDLAILNDKSDQILNILQKLDPTIAEIRSLTINEPDIYLRRKGENFLPISLFGDCFNRVLDIILRIINSKNSVCLIDEIENGIHYQNQREFWRSLFKLAVELDVQIFATTHSLEMIQAFADVGLNSYPNEGAYLELARNEQTNQIVGIKRDLELLQYSLKHEEGVGLRGE